VKFSASAVLGIALHPSMPVSYIAFSRGLDIPRDRFIVYHESKGEAREGEDLIGTYLAIDPSGKFLMTGYRDIYEKGSRLLINPDRVHVLPEYGSIDWLMRYSLDRTGQPDLDETKKDAGGNGRGMRLSSDGKRVTYLSVVGSPKFAHNLAGWDPTDLNKLPVTYTTHNIASTEFAAFHPFLPLLACLSPQNDPVFYDIESGDQISGKVQDDTGKVPGERMHNLFFSPDGKYVVLDTSVNEIRYFRSLELTLSPPEAKRVQERWAKAAVSAASGKASSADVTSLKVPLKKIDALQGGKGRPMTPKEIGGWFSESVVVVQSGDASGSGFIVGSDGYVLTCAHCVDAAESIEVTYRSGANSAQTLAHLVSKDDERDLALLKLDLNNVKLRAIRVGSSDALEAGDSLTVISNPGFRSAILDFTMTQGIVSSPRRALDGQTFIQSTAQVNPGSSGGPLFNDHGLVVGLVVSKANLEGTGFAIPAADLLSFLINSCVKLGEDGQFRREWMDSTGTYRIDAKFQEVREGQLKLLKIDGKEVAVPLSKLSAHDKALVDLLQQ
jgi:serine protease Do